MAELAAALGPDGVLTDPAVTAAYARDRAMLAEAGTPAAVVLPRTVITEATPARPVTLVATFATTAQTGQVVERVVATGLIEVIDNTCVCAVDDLLHADLDRGAHAVLVAQSERAARPAGLLNPGKVFRARASALAAVDALA